MRIRHVLPVIATAGVVAASLAGCAASAPQASVTSVKPAAGGVLGANTVTIRGDNLGDVAAVSFGGEQVPVRKSSTDKKIKVTAPPAANYQPASVPVKLESSGGKRMAKAHDYTYTAASPVDKEMQYAMARWNNYNTAEYGNLNSVGGDCANFVSQALIARGWQMSDEWYNHDAGGDWSPAWGYVPAMENFFENNHSALGLTELTYDQRDQVAVGDIVIFDWNDNDSPDHVMLVSKVVHSQGNVDIKMVGHNDDYAYRDLGETIQKKYPDALVTFWHFAS